MSKLRVLIGGGSGFVGRALTASLESQGHKVTTISRTPAASGLSWDDIKKNGLPTSTDAVINLSGANIMDLKKLWTRAYKEECRISRVSTTKLLAQAVADNEHPPSVWISTSAVGFYPPHADTRYDETSPITGDRDWAAELCTAIEEASDLTNSKENCEHFESIRSVVMRTGIVLGQGGGAFENMRLPFLFGLGGTFGDGSHWFPFVHLKDVVRAYEFALFDPRPQGPLNLVAPHTCTNKEFTKALGAAMRRPTVIPVPRFMSTLMGKDRGSLLFDGQHVTPAALTSLGFEFEFPDVTSCCANLAGSS